MFCSNSMQMHVRDITFHHCKHSLSLTERHILDNAVIWIRLFSKLLAFPVKYSIFYMILQCRKLGKIFTCPTHKLFLSFMLISDVYRSFIPNKTTFTKHCLTQWISKFPGSFEIHWVRQYLVNFTGVVGIVSATKPSQFSQVAGMAHGPVFFTPDSVFVSR